MAHRVNISVSVPDNLYEGVVLPAKNNHVLAELVCSCLELYSRSAPVKEYVDTGAQAKADSEWDAVLDSLNAAVGALDSDVSYLGDNLEAGKSKVAKGYSNAKGEGVSGGLGEVSSQELRKVSERVISLEEGFGSVKSMLEDVLGYVKGMSEGSNRSAAVVEPATNKSFAVEDESGETFPGGGSNETQVSGYSVVQDLKPDTLDNRSYDTEEEPSERKQEQEPEPEPTKVDPQVDSVLSNLADSIRGDMW